MGQWHDFSIKAHEDGRLDVIDPPPIGALSAFTLQLLAEADRGISVDPDGRLVVLGMVFRLVGLDPGGNRYGPPQMLVGERVS